MDWVHCNNCFLLPDGQKCFFLTSCGHIFCSSCEQQCARELCKLCGNQCNTIPLSSTMKPDVQIYFTDPDELLKKKIREVQQVSQFQNNHRARLLTYYKKQNNKFRQMKEDFRKILKNLQDLDSERKRLSKENSSLKSLVGMPSKMRPVADVNLNSADISARGLAAVKGHTISPFENTPPSSAISPVFSKFFGKLDSCGSQSAIQDRVSVFSPPVNGRIGMIPGTPSPSSALKKLNISEYSSGSGQRKSNAVQYNSSPNCSQDSNGNTRYAPITPGSTASSPFDPVTGAMHKAYQCRRDAARKVVVHPYSPDD